ncbi:MAG: aldo/keto reductase [Thermoplasmatota archaeon]
MGAQWKDLRIDSRIRLNNGEKMPVFGLGTYRSGIGRQTREAVRTAVDLGYRMVDTATIYGNERDVAAGIRESDRDRSEVFISTKLWNADHGYEKAGKALRKSLEMLGTDYVDLYLQHWPVKGLRKESWRAMVELNREGYARSIGVSNYTIKHLEELMDSSDIVPAVNQVEYSPFTIQKDLLEFCRKNGIQLESYSPLTKGQRLDDPAVVGIADELGRTPAQVLLRWVLETEVVAIPKSTKQERIRENSRIFDFELGIEQRTALDGLDEDLRTGWDPTDED